MGPRGRKESDTTERYMGIGISSIIFGFVYCVTFLLCANLKLLYQLDNWLMFNFVISFFVTGNFPF